MIIIHFVQKIRKHFLIMSVGTGLANPAAVHIQAFTTMKLSSKLISLPCSVQESCSVMLNRSMKTFNPKNIDNISIKPAVPLACLEQSSVPCDASSIVTYNVLYFVIIACIATILNIHVVEKGV